MSLAVLRAESCLSRWFPRVRDAGLPVPRTEILRVPDPDLMDRLAWGTRSPWDQPKLDDFSTDVLAACYRLRVKDGSPFPVFLRTGHGSGKHDWEETCYLAAPEDIPARVHAIAEWSHLADIAVPLPTDVWVVRELLKTEPAFHAFRGRMPITREHRVFVREGKVICSHPYWPADCIEGHDPSEEDWRARLKQLSELPLADMLALVDGSIRASELFEGAWSVDWLWTTDRGWVLIDMARAEISWHWPGCKALEHDP